MNPREVASELLAAGLCVLPVRDDGSKYPPLDWTPYQTRKPTEAEHDRWFRDCQGFCVVCGVISGNLELLEFDDPELYGPWCDLVRAEAPGLLERIPVHQSPGGGYHLYYRCAEIAGNLTLARGKRELEGEIKVVAIVATRGEGGVSVIAPTSARYHLAGKPYKAVQGSILETPIITPEERALLHLIAREFNEYNPPEREHPTEPGPNAGNRPGDLWALDHTWADILEPHGWRLLRTRDGTGYWQRPDKDGPGCSATIGHDGHDILYVFSSNALPFEPDQGYGKPTAYALLNHGGDFDAAVKDFVSRGYSTETTRRVVAEPPELPQAAQPSDSLGQATGWLDLYVDYARQVSPMTPDSFHLSAGLWLAAVAIARRLWLNVGFGFVYPNLFVLWLAVTTLFHKSTSLAVCKGICHKALPHLLAPQEVSVEGFLAHMAGLEPRNLDKLPERQRNLWGRSRDHAAQKGWVLDEASGLLASAGRDYNKGLIESMMRFYDCDGVYTRQTVGQGIQTVTNACLSFLGASTPAAMAQHLRATNLWVSGWWPRFAILTPEIERPEWKRPTEIEEPPELSASLYHLYDRLPEAAWPDTPGALSVTIDETALESWWAYNQAVQYDMLTSGAVETELFGIYGRLPTKVVKVATILAALGWPDSQNAPHITQDHLARAIRIAESWRASAHRALDMARQVDADRLHERILRQVAQHGEKGATARDVYRGLGDRQPHEVEHAMTDLVLVGELERLEQKGGKGRPTVRYRIATE